MSYGSSIERLLIRRLLRRPRELVEGMICIDDEEYATESELDFNEGHSVSLSDLDDLPLELLHRILNLLDFRSIITFTEVCTRALTVTRSLPSYRDLIGHAPDTLGALALTGLITYHSAAELHATLLSSACVSCGGFGAFLFLPTCERCCHSCLWTNRALWVITPQMTKLTFGTTTAQLKRLSIMRSLPRLYCMRQEYDRRHSFCNDIDEFPWEMLTVSRKQRIRFVSVKQAKQLALENLPEDQLEHDFERRVQRSMVDPKFHLTDRRMNEYLLATPMDGLPREKKSSRWYGDKPKDNNCFMASIPFPYVTSDGVTNMGRWCKGCKQMHDDYARTYELPKDVARLIPKGRDEREYLDEQSLLAWSNKGFLEHVMRCPGARKMFPELKG